MNKNLTVCNHPIIEHNLSVIRNLETNSDTFRIAVKRLTYVLMYEATKNIPLETINIQTPLTQTQSKRIASDCEIIVAPILRAGLIFSDVAMSILPTASIQHIGMYRDEETLQPIWYFNKTPIYYENPENIFVYILDPMLATGNSALEVIKLFVGKNIPVSNIKFISLVSAPQGVKRIHDEFQELEIYTAALDEGLNEKGYILPGLGDAGDRLFNTPSVS